MFYLPGFHSLNTKRRVSVDTNIFFFFFWLGDKKYMYEKNERHYLGNEPATSLERKYTHKEKSRAET